MTIPAHRINPTFDTIAVKELHAKGYTCRSCEHWTMNGCEIGRPSFPKVCRLYEYCPGVDEPIDHERNHEEDKPR